MNIDAGDIAKIATGLGSLGAGFAFARPFAERIFAFWLDRLKARAEIADGKERSIERIALQGERTVGVLEAVDRRLDRIDARLDRIEGFHGISPSPSAVPPQESHSSPRAAITGQHGALTASGAPVPRHS